jgi:alpha-D-ribose 1-methylphosphonate 5-triphosphate diphosphatase
MARSPGRIAQSLRPNAKRRAEHAPFTITNVRAILPTGEHSTSIVVRDGLIHRMDSAHAAMTRRVEGENDYLLPGLIDLHSSNLEHHLEPRPGVYWRPERAVLAHDAEIAAAGITTALDAILLDGDDALGARERAFFDSMTSMDAAAAEGLLRVEHRWHLRCELGNLQLEEQLYRAASSCVPSLVSLVEPPFSDQHSALNRERALAFAHEHDCVVASHDDATHQDVVRASESFCSIAEFPESIDAAREARNLCMRVVAGAPNLVRGGSQNGEVAVADLVGEGLVDILSSDFCPSSLLHAVFMLSRDFAMPLHLAVATASTTPASVMGLTDRGAIQEGLRADLVRVRDTSRGPVIVSAWCGGRQIA